MGHRLGTGAEPHRAADIVPPGAAECALVAGEADFEGDGVAWLEVGDVGADGCDDARRLVAEGEGFADENVAVAEVRKVVQVGAAEAG